MTTGTTLFAFKRALIHRLSARPGLAGVQVSYEFPAAELANEAIWLADADTISLTARPAQCEGPAPVDEVYTVVVAIQVLRVEGEGQQDADRRADELLAELQQELAERPQTTDVIHHADLAGWANKSLAHANNVNGAGSRFDVTIAVEATLAP